MLAFSTLLLPTAALFATRVAGDACVVGGPITRVLAGERCCTRVSGGWFSNYPNQGICVLKASAQPAYDKCVADYAPLYQLVCIECDETVDCGLSPTEG